MCLSPNRLDHYGAAAGYTFDAAITPAANDGAALGVSGTAWSDAFFASGAVVDFAASDVTITHSTDTLTVGGGDLRVTTAGTNAASAVTVGGTQTLTNKTLTSPSLTTPAVTNPVITDRLQIKNGALLIEFRVTAAGNLEIYQGTTKIAALSTAGKLQVNGDLEAFAGLV
jgi:hypothetical protein